MIVALSLAQDFLWRLELPLSTWAATFQGFATSLREPLLAGQLLFSPYGV